MGTVIGIVGSPRRDGNSAHLLELVLNALRARAETETVHLKDYRIQPCEACHCCEANGRCVLDDGMRDLVPKLEAADAIVLASPAYMGGLTSRMRAFMERTWPLREGQLAGKVGAGIVVGRRKTGAAVYAMEDFLARLRLTRVPGVCGYAFEKGDIADDAEALSDAGRLADAILAEIGP